MSADVVPTERTTISTIVGWGLAVELDIPAGALDEETSISVRAVSIGGYVGVQLEPQGLLLNTPASLRFLSTTSAEGEANTGGGTGDGDARHTHQRGVANIEATDGSLSLDAPVYARDGWDDNGNARFAPRWRSADQRISIMRLRPVMILTTFPDYDTFAVATSTADPAGPTTTIESMLTTIAPTTTTTIAVPEIPADAPDVIWERDISPVLADPATASSNAADRAAWVLEREADEDAGASGAPDPSGSSVDPDNDRNTEIKEAGNRRYRYLAEKCSEKKSTPRTNAELADLVNNLKQEPVDVKSVEGCLTLAWQVSGHLQGELPMNGETIAIDDYQLARGELTLDDGSGASTAPIYGRANGWGAGVSLFASGLAKVGSEMTGVDDPYAISAKYCPDSPDEQSGVMEVQIDPLPENQLRLKITPKPGQFSVCGPKLKGEVAQVWNYINTMRGEAPGTPIVLNVPVRPNVSRNIGFLEQLEGTKVTLTENRPAALAAEGFTWRIDFQVLLTFAPVR